MFALSALSRDSWFACLYLWSAKPQSLNKRQDIFRHRLTKLQGSARLKARKRNQWEVSSANGKSLVPGCVWNVLGNYLTAYRDFEVCRWIYQRWSPLLELQRSLLLASYQGLLLLWLEWWVGVATNKRSMLCSMCQNHFKEYHCWSRKHIWCCSSRVHHSHQCCAWHSQCHDFQGTAAHGNFCPYMSCDLTGFSFEESTGFNVTCIKSVIKANVMYSSCLAAVQAGC